MRAFRPKLRAIVRREYLQRVRSRWFLFSTLGLPLLFIGIVFLSGWLATGSSGSVSAYTAAVIDRAGGAGPLLVAELAADSMAAVVDPDLREASEESLPARLLASAHDAFVVLPEDMRSGDARARLLARDYVSEQAIRTIREAVDRAALRARLAGAGVGEVDARALLAHVPVQVISVSEAGARSQEVFRVISLVIAFLFYMVLILYGQMIVRAVIEEKSSDIVEVMISSVRPWELMAGKIVGVGAVGLTQVVIWAAVIAGLTLYGLTAGAGMLERAGIDPGALAIPTGAIVLTLGFLVLGYLLYASLFAAVGATLSNEHDAQQAMFPILLLIIIPFVLVQGVVLNPGAGWAVAASLVPFFSPLLMPARVLVSSVPAAELVAALLLLAGSIAVFTWLSGRIYRVGILMKGKRPNLPELVRWVRHG